jgi:hypothetical protein
MQALHWALAMTPIQVAKLNGVNPMGYIADVLERVVSGRTKQTDLHALLPWNWTARHIRHGRKPRRLNARSLPAPIVKSNPALALPRRLRFQSIFGTRS